MFPSAPDQPRTASRTLRAVLRDAADLTIALVTLESYGLDDLRPRRSADIDRAVGRAPITSPAATDEPFARDTQAAASTMTSGRSPLAASHGSVAASPRSPQYPHRADLRVPARARRPGAGVPQDQLCMTPTRGRAPQDQTSLAPLPRRRTAPQDTPH